MKSIITASVEFYFKGEKHTPSILLDMDVLIQAGGRFPDLYMLIAQENNLDLYSYEYEMMQAEKITYSSAQGLVKEFVINGVLDLAAFGYAWRENKVQKDIQYILTKNKIPDDLRKHSGVEKALIEIYRLGEQDGVKKSDN